MQLVGSFRQKVQSLSIKKKKKSLIHSPYICVLTKLSFVCMFAIQYKDIFLTKVKALAKIPFFREMPRFIYCRLNDIFSLIMTFRIGFEFLYQINKNVSTFKYYLEGGVKLYWCTLAISNFLLFVGHPNVIYAAPSLKLKVFSFFCGSRYILNY